jgi:spore maturation protein CgeB
MRSGGHHDMRIVVFCHSLLSDWNHGNAHFLRGVTAELLDRGHDVRVYEPRDAWSRTNLVRAHGTTALDAVRATFPWMAPHEYDPATLDLDEALDHADLVLVHEWNDHALVKRIGECRARDGAGFRLLFHDTHHRAVTQPKEIARYDLTGYDGVLAFGRVIRDLYLDRDWTEHAWTWHEAADTRVFHPRPASDRENDLVWIGNWGDGERGKELREFLLRPARRLGLEGSIHGVRYPRRARLGIRLAGLRYRGWLANHDAPEQFARHRVTVHVPRRPYVEKLPGIPTIRPFEALACGIPLVTSPWSDAEGLFRAGEDHLVARDGREMQRHLQTILEDEDLAASLSRTGLETIRTRHTCAHRVDELMAVAAELGVDPARAAA